MSFDAIGRFLAVCVLVLTFAWSAAAQTTGDWVAAAHEKATAAEASLANLRDDYAGLTGLRDNIEADIERLRARLKELEPRKTALQQTLTQLGPKPAGEEPPVVAAQRRRATEAQAAFDAEYRQVLVTFQLYERIWNNVTEMRRALFSARLFMHVDSILEPSVWTGAATFQLPKLATRTRWMIERWTNYVHEHENADTAIAFAACSVALAGCFAWLHRLAVRRRRRVETDDVEATEIGVIRRGAVILFMRSVPLAATMLLFNFVLRRLDLAPDDIDDFLLSIAIAIFVVGLARGAMDALLAPGAARWRIVRCRDETARMAATLVVSEVRIYTLGIVLASYQRLIGARVEAEVVTIMLLTAAMIARAIWSFRRLGQAGVSEPSGFVTLNLGWLRPLSTLVCVVCALSLVFGYVALAGFVSGRAVFSAGTVAVAIFVVVALNRLFDRRQLSVTPAGEAIGRSTGVSGRTLDLSATVISGVFRIGVIVTAGLIVTMPWGLTYGDVNPFADFGQFVSTTDVHRWLGSAGFGLLVFTVGLTGTRVIVGWLESALLPRTSLDESVRHSIRTVIGYAGFAITTLIALSILGINAQNVAVVAGALSVGIGFGLQSIVSNFVSGLIVLAERPVRVGDVIVVKGEEGRVQRISVRSTLIATFEQSSLIVPNTDLITSIVRNRTLADPTQQLRITLTLDHDADPALATELILGLIDQNPNALKSPPPRVLFMRVTELGQELEVRASIDRLENMLIVRTALHHQFVRAFRENGIGFARLPASLSAAARALPKR